MNKETNKWEEEFKENFIGHIKHISVGQYDEGGVNIGFLSAEEVIIKFIQNLLKQQKQSLVEKIDGMKQTPANKGFEKWVIGYNQALEDIKKELK